MASSNPAAHSIDPANNSIPHPSDPQERYPSVLKLYKDVRPHLEAAGCLATQGLPKPSLSNDIHHLFQKSRWVTASVDNFEEVYERMTPALQLASRFITSEAAILPYWPHVLFGKRVQVHENDENLDYLEISSNELCPEAVDRVREAFSGLSENISLAFMEENPTNTSLEGLCGATFRERERSVETTGIPFSEDAWPPVENGKPHPTITLNAHYHEFFASRYSNATRRKRLRVLFCFAVTLIHETVHAFCFSTHPTWKEEPWYNKESISSAGHRQEMGFAWERFMFGGRTDAWYPMEKLRALHYQEVRDLPPVKEDTLMVDGKEAKFLGSYQPASAQGKRFVHDCIPLEWIASWFSDERWALWEQNGEYKEIGKRLRVVVDMWETETRAYIAEVDSKIGESLFDS
ncbi:hypothetical protein BU16DRAFT_566079 [Lophium mytilinum]|uniref:Uncharacterized protein n=1 Tax=Lophium mytilinum TaxID=390894 RepID=A0A6A6QGM4_9PEZI|nr:hypothetical protein BU16DRAFT_566079 [Lophium mytilinum]